MKEKLAEYGAMQERVRVEMEVKGGELRQVKERGQVRENECLQACMALKRQAEVLSLARARSRPLSLARSLARSLSLCIIS